MKRLVLLIIFLCSAPAAHAQGKIQDGLLKMYKGNTIGHLATSKKLKLNGVAFQYANNGNIQRQSWYEKGELQGPTKYFSPENKLVRVETYEHDKLLDVKKVNK